MGGVVIITQARLNSSRFSKKILERINGQTLIEIHLDRLSKSKYSENLTVATTFEDGIEELLDILNKKEIRFFQGSTTDVLDRYYNAAIDLKPNYIVRVTSDCPLIDPKLMDQIIDFALEQELDYVSNILIEKFPDGQDVEVIKWSALSDAWRKSSTIYDREHVTPFIKKNSTFLGGKKYTSKNFDCNQDFNHIRMTVDEFIDYDAINILIESIGLNSDWLTYTNYILKNPHLFKNQKIIRNQGSKK